MTTKLIAIILGLLASIMKIIGGSHEYAQTLALVGCIWALVAIAEAVEKK